MLASIDEVLRAVRATPGIWTDLEPQARWLVDDARHHGPLKLGIALLGAIGDESDIERLRLLARHSDFTLYAVVAMVNLLDDPVDELWDNARATTGWGRIETVRRLAPRATKRPDVQRWLLLDGWKDAILDDYLALACATGGDLVGALKGEVDEPTLNAACSIIDALCGGGPGPGMDRYADGPEAVAGLLAELETRCRDLDRLDLVALVRDWLENESAKSAELEERWEARSELIAACDGILLDPDWGPRVLARFRDGTDRGESQGWRLGVALGLDLWDELFDRLQADGLDRWRAWRLIDATTDEQRRRLVDWAEATIPLDRIAAGGPRGERGSPLSRGYEVLFSLLTPSPEWARHLSPRVLTAALTSPNRTCRVLSGRVLTAIPRDERDPAVIDQPAGPCRHWVEP